MYKVTKYFDFEAAHHLENYKGKCSNIHGHSYRVAVTFAGNQLDEVGMLIDFHRIKILATKYIMDKYDHTDLNQSMSMVTAWGKNPTAENMAESFFHSFEDAIAGIETYQRNVVVDNVKVWETKDSYATFSK